MHQPDFFNNEPLLLAQVYAQLNIQWRTMLLAIPEQSPTSAELDEVQFAIILLSQMLPAECDKLITSQSMQNRELCYGRSYGDINAYSWQLLMPQLPELQQKSFTQLESMLCIGNSGIRTWFLKIGWLLRAKLNAKLIIPKLLANVANTLVGVEQSYALAYTIFTGKGEDFNAYALSLNPDPQFRDQYINRLEKLSGMGADLICGSNWKMEAMANKRIIENTSTAARFMRSAHLIHTA